MSIFDRIKAKADARRLAKGRTKYQNKALTNVRAGENTNRELLSDIFGQDNKISLDAKNVNALEVSAERDIIREDRTVPETKPETAAEYRTRKAQELEAKKQALVDKQKAVTASKAMEQGIPDITPIEKKTNTKSGIVNPDATEKSGHRTEYTDAEIKQQNRDAKPDDLGVTSYKKKVGNKWVQKYSGDSNARANVKNKWAEVMGKDAVFPGFSAAMKKMKGLI